MRLIGLIVSGALAVTVIAEGAYIVHTRRQVERLATRLEAIGNEAAELLSDPDSRASARALDPQEDAMGASARRGGTRALPPPRLVTQPSAEPAHAPAPTSNDPLPLPPAIDSPQAREQLRQFVVAQLEQEREQGRARQEQRFQEREQARRDRLAKDLGLSPPETEKFNRIMSDVQTAREALRSRVESGELTRDAVGKEMAAMREKNDQQMRGLLGDERMKKLEEARRRGPGPMQGGGAGRWGMWGEGGGRRAGGGTATSPP